MWSDYFFYLMGLPEKDRNIQIIIMISFWSFFKIVGIIVDTKLLVTHNKNGMSTLSSKVCNFF